MKTAPGAARDVVELVNGNRIEGKILEVSATHVVVDLGGQTMSLERNTVRAIQIGGGLQGRQP